jgi:hypothetical protein
MACSDAIVLQARDIRRSSGCLTYRKIAIGSTRSVYHKAERGSGPMGHSHH